MEFAARELVAQALDEGIGGRDFGSAATGQNDHFTCWSSDRQERTGASRRGVHQQGVHRIAQTFETQCQPVTFRLRQLRQAEVAASQRQHADAARSMDDHVVQLP